MKTLAASAVVLLTLAGCATDSGPTNGPAVSPLTFTGKVIEKAGRCHTVQASGGDFNGDLFAVDRGILRGISVGSRVRVQAYSARLQNCPGAQRIVVTSLQPLRRIKRSRRPGRTRTFTNPRSRGLWLDHCRRYRRDCGRLAAAAFCRRNGFARAVRYSTRPASRTRVHDSGRICRSRGRRVCRRFKVIRCRT
jgi:hypothetical protein